MNNSSIKIIVCGGSTAGLDELETGLQGFNNVINASTEFTRDSPGVPLIYKFKNVIDNTPAPVTLTSQYTSVSSSQLKQFVRIKVLDFLCTMNDDGIDPRDAGNITNRDLEMDRFYVWANAFNGTGSDDPFVQIYDGDQQVYAYSTANWIVMNKDDSHAAGTSIVLTFDTENYDFNFAKLELKAYAREWDRWEFNLLKPNDAIFNAVTNSLPLLGDEIFGPHIIELSCSDFTFNVNILVTKENK